MWIDPTTYLLMDHISWKKFDQNIIIFYPNLEIHVEFESYKWIISNLSL